MTIPARNPKRRIQSLLRGTNATTGFYGLPDVFANTDGITTELLEKEEFTAAESAELLTKLATLTITDRVRGGFTRFPRRYPQWVVLRTSSREAERNVVGHMGGEERADEDAIEDEQSGTILWGAYFEEQYKIAIECEEAEERDLLWVATREILLRGQGYFEGDARDANEEDGLIALAEMGQIAKIAITGGRDQELWFEQADPHLIYQGEILLSAAILVAWTESAGRNRNIRSYLKDAGGVNAIPYEEVE